MNTILYCVCKDLNDAVILLVSERSGSSHKGIITETLTWVT